MYKILSFLSEEHNLSEYKDGKDLKNSYTNYVDGLEIIRCGKDRKQYITEEMVLGVHLPFYSDWLSFWKQDEKLLTREFGNREVWKTFYGGSHPEILLDFFKQDMEYAKKMKAKYVVFHVSNVSIIETFSRNFDYSDREVIDASIELINRLFVDGEYEFELLLENLPWPGLNYRSGEMAARLLEGIHYKKTGLMLDTGHMMCTNLNIKTPEEGVDYIIEWFTQHDELLPYVRGMHIHQSVSGDFVKESMKKEWVLEKDFYKKFAQAYDYVFQVDRHEVLDAKNAKQLIAFMDPTYLVYEFRANHREEREEKLKRQSRIWS